MEATGLEAEKKQKNGAKMAYFSPKNPKKRAV